ncbi:hypothetical protein MPTK2_1g25430 [Marchantia polymorpha subsp. ruderalis]
MQTRTSLLGPTDGMLSLVDAKISRQTGMRQAEGSEYRKRRSLFCLLFFLVVGKDGSRAQCRAIILVKWPAVVIPGRSLRPAEGPFHLPAIDATLSHRIA